MADVRALVAFAEQDSLMTKAFLRFADVLEYSFNDETLLKKALTLGFGNYNIGYERLEFLGDRVLGLIVAEMLCRAFPDEKEGGLAVRHAFLVSGEILAAVAEKAGIPEYLIVSKTEESAVNRHSVNILADVCEAVIAALYLDGGLDEAKKFVEKYWAPLLETVKNAPLNPKTALQEWTQKSQIPLPVYTVVKKEGSQHEPIFTVEAAVRGYSPVRATASSKHGAEKEAAALLLKEIKGNG